MKEQAVALARKTDDPAAKLNVMREYLQALTMRSLHESEAFLRIAFVGGTALRFLFDLPRFSEDLDFSLVEASGFEPEKWMHKLKRDLALAGFDPAIRWNSKNTVHKGWIRVPELLRDAGLSAMRDEKISIKVEIDTRPPAGAVSETRVINRHVTFAVRFHKLPSLMAGKVHVLIARGYPKGRDWYDFLWYGAQRPPVEPNAVLLQNAFDQTQGSGAFSAERWKEHVRTKVETLDDTAIRDDVRPFLEHPREADLLTKDNLRSLLR